jgi:hypothetical protein
VDFVLHNQVDAHGNPVSYTLADARHFSDGMVIKNPSNAQAIWQITEITSKDGHTLLPEPGTDAGNHITEIRHQYESWLSHHNGTTVDRDPGATPSAPASPDVAAPVIDRDPHVNPWLAGSAAVLAAGVGTAAVVTAARRVRRSRGHDPIHEAEAEAEAHAREFINGGYVDSSEDWLHRNGLEVRERGDEDEDDDEGYRRASDPLDYGRDYDDLDLDPPVAGSSPAGPRPDFGAPEFRGRIPSGPPRKATPPPEWPPIPKS